MTNFEKITETPKTLAELLASLMVINSPWEDAFRKKFCDTCIQENCGGGGECKIKCVSSQEGEEVVE